MLLEILSVGTCASVIISDILFSRKLYQASPPLLVDKFTTSPIDNDPFSFENLVSLHKNLEIRKDVDLESSMSLIFKLLQSVRNGDFSFSRHTSFSVLRHESIPVEIWTFERTSDRCYIIIEVNGEDVADFTWHDDGNITEFTYYIGFLNQDVLKDFKREFLYTSESLELLPSHRVKNKNEHRLIQSNSFNGSLLTMPAELVKDVPEIDQAFQLIHSAYLQIAQNLSDLDIEDQHRVERCTETTFPNLVRAFCELGKAQQTERLPDFLIGLSNIADDLQRQLNRMNERKVQAFAKQFQLTQINLPNE